MQLAHRVSLAGVQLDSVDSRIIIKGIEEAAGKEAISAVSFGGRDGQYVTKRRRDTLDVTVKFALNVRRDSMQTRSEIFEKVNSWAAGGGWLEVNYKSNRRLYVICAQTPGAGDQWQRTNIYSITFRAYGVPYWREKTANTITKTNISSLNAQAETIKGSVRTVMDVEFKNTSGSTADTFSITTGGSTIAFSSLGLANNETLEIDHKNDGTLRIRIKNAGGTYRSAMDKRTPESADDLFVEPGTQNISMTSQKAGNLTVSHVGRFL